MQNANTLPVALVAGFLGSGKTTLMRRLILDARDRGIKLAVIVNEFGAADVDSNILREADAELIAGIAGGCACCSGQEDFYDALLEIASRPVAERPDLVLVETSGLADPILLLDVMTDAQLLPLLRESAIVTVIDSGRWMELATTLGTLLRRQTQLADVVVLNKIDLVDSSHRHALEAKIREISPRAAVAAAIQCDFDLDLIWHHTLVPKQDTPPIPQSEIRNPQSEHAHYHTVVCPLPHPVEKEKLEQALEKLPPDVWRAKGFVRLRGEAGLHLVQYTGGGTTPGRHMIAPFYLPSFGVEPDTLLVFIGAALDREQILADFLGRDKLLSII
jgi:G3E family GTPase